MRVPTTAQTRESARNRACTAITVFDYPEISRDNLVSGAYNYAPAKWLEENLKPLSTTKYCINNIFGFIEDIKNTGIEPNHILVSYDASALITNVPLKETNDILIDKAFAGDWCNKMHSMQLQKHQLTDLLKMATTNQLFQFNGELYEQTDGVAMGSPLGPLLANVPYRKPARTKEHDSVLLSKIR